MVPRLAEKVLSILGLVPSELDSIHSDLTLYICHAIMQSDNPVSVKPRVKNGLEAGLVSVSEINGMYGSQPSKTHAV